jgi:hypothetical protein
MANTYKNIVITPNIGNTSDPRVQFSGGNTTANTDINLYVYPTTNGTLSFEGSVGQLFSITNDLTGSIFSVNDVSGIPSIEVFANGLVSVAQYSGNVGISNTTPAHKLSVSGTTFLGGAVSGITTLAGGNTTITGFANVSSNINAASFNVGATQFANTLGVYATHLSGTAAASYALLASPAFTGTVTAANVEADYFVSGTVTPQTIVSGVPTYQAHDTTNFIAGKTFASVSWNSGTGAGAAGQFLLAKAKSGTVGSFTSGAVLDGDALGRVAWAGANSGAFNIAAEIQSNVDGTPTGAFVPSSLSFRTSNTTVATSTRLFIAANGNVGVNTATPSRGLQVSGTTNLDGSIFYTSRPTTGTATALHINTTSGLLQASTSSRKTKHSIVDYDKGIEAVRTLRPVYFKYIGENILNAGFIAEEFDEAGLNEFVLYDANNEPEAIQYSQVCALLAKAIQEQQIVIEQLKARIEALENTP